jgi:hypothetical protein
MKQQQRGEKFHPLSALFTNHPSQRLYNKAAIPLN